MTNRTAPSVQRISELQKLVADFSRIQRAIHLADTGRLENDVEHSFGLALTCWFIAVRSAPQLDLQKILLYALAHDLVEIYSGDTFVFDAERVKTKSAREDAALQQLKKDWPDFPELAAAARAYKDKSDAEAKFVYTVDKMLPPMMVNLGEQQAFWDRHKITQEQHEAEKRSRMHHSPEAAHYLEEFLAWMAQPNFYHKPRKRSRKPSPQA